MSHLKILINGAGIAGNALAFWLAALRHNVTVVERFPGLRTSGLQLDLRGAGIPVLRRMGLEAAFRAHAAPEEGFQSVDATGKRLSFLPANKSGQGKQNFTSDFEIMRGDLCRMLHDAALTRAHPPTYVFGTAVASIAPDANAVDVRFENGQTDRFDLVIGADGQWSRTRRLMNGLAGGGADTLQAVPGLCMAYFTVRRPMQPGDDQFVSTLYKGPDERNVFMRRHAADAVSVILGSQDPDAPITRVPRGDTAAEKQAFVEQYRGAGWITDELLAGMQADPDFYCERVGVVRQTPWSRGRVALVGDAAYCPSVVTGMGTTAAMVGAYILAGELARAPGDIEAALGRYEACFAPFMDDLRKDVMEKADNIKSAEAPSDVREAVEGWTLPTYEALAEAVIG